LQHIIDMLGGDRGIIRKYRNHDVSQTKHTEGLVTTQRHWE